MDGSEHYVPRRMRRSRIALEPVGQAVFDELDTDAQEDVIQCITRRLVPRQASRTFRHRQSMDVRRSLVGQVIPVYLVDPELLIGDEGRDVRVEDVKTYMKLLGQDLASMPPVVIDSENLEYPLCEGGHRTVAAILEGLPKIYAIDVATAYVQGDEIMFRKAT